MPIAAIAAVAAAAVAAAGTGLSLASAADERQSMQDAMNKQLAAQKQYQDQANAAAAQRLAGAGPQVAQKEIAQGTQDLQQKYNAITQVPLSQPGQQNAPTTSLVPDKGTQQQNAMSNQARAALGGYNEWTLDQWIKDLRANQQLGVAAQAANLTQQQLPWNLFQAQQSAQGLATAGTGLTAAGGLGGALATYYKNNPTATGAGYTGTNFYGTDTGPSVSTDTGPGGLH